jgi:hypothetical protein
MSYDFMMFAPRGAIGAMADIQPKNLRLQNSEAVKSQLAELFPAIVWEDKGDRGWLGKLSAGDDWYEFRLPGGDDECWTMSTAEDNDQPELVAKVCAALAVLAFDGQALALIDADGSRPA